MRRLWAGLAMAVALAGITAGGVVITPEDDTPEEGTANLWIDDDGGTCTRQSTAGAYVNAAACSSLNAAYAAASGGDTINVKCGTYGAQSVDDRSIGTSVVTIQKDPGDDSCEMVTITSASLYDFTSDANYVIYDGFQGDVANRDGFGLGPFESCGTPYSGATPGCTLHLLNVTMRNFHFNWGKAFSVNGLTLEDGEIGPFDAADSCGDPEDGLQIGGMYTSGGGFEGPNSIPAYNVTIDNVYFNTIENSTYPSCGAHTDALQGFGYNNWTIRNSRFNNVSTCILAYSQTESNPYMVDTFLIENNIFNDNDGSIPHCVTLGNGEGESGVQCGADSDNNVVQNNTFISSSGESVNIYCDGSGTDGIVRNNVFTNNISESCTSGHHNVIWDYNAFGITTPSDCRASLNAHVCNVSFAAGPSAATITGTDIQSGDTCAKDWAPTTGGTFPATDIHGTARHLGSGVDAGVHEVG